MDQRPLALYRRYFWEHKNIIFVYTNSVDKLIASKKLYNDICGIAQTDGDVVTNAMDELLVSATLAAESQMTREMWGWTIRLPFKKWGLFCGVEPDGGVCCKMKILPNEAAKDVIGAIAVQRVEENAPVRQSMLVPRDTQVHLIVEQYFDESEQLPARVAICGNEALMALSMPDAAWCEVENLSETDLIAKFHDLLKDGETEVPEIAQEEAQDDRLAKVRAQYQNLKSGSALSHGELLCTHEAVFFYECRCNEEQMKKVIAALPPSQQDELWAGTDHLDIECPRCGRKHVIRKS